MPLSCSLRGWGISGQAQGSWCFGWSWSLEASCLLRWNCAICCWSPRCPRTLQVYGSGGGSDEKPLILSTPPLCKQRGASCGTVAAVWIHCSSDVPCKAVLWTPHCVSSFDGRCDGEVFDMSPVTNFETKLIARSPRLEQEEEELSHLVILLRVCLGKCVSISECTWNQKYQKYRAAVWLPSCICCILHWSVLLYRGERKSSSGMLEKSSSSWVSLICMFGKILHAVQRMYPQSPLKEHKRHTANGKHPTVLVVLNKWPSRRTEIFTCPGNHYLPLSLLLAERLGTAYVKDGCQQPRHCTQTPGSAETLPFMYWVTWLLDLS